MNKKIILIIFLFSLLFAPIPEIVTRDVYCAPCNEKIFFCHCPQKGDLTWQPSFTMQLWQRYQSLVNTNQSTEGVIVTEQVITEKLPWAESSCGNGVCERCESESDCCNYPPKKDKNGKMIYPPPTCLGHCPEDCKDNVPNKFIPPEELQVSGTITSFENTLEVDGNCEVTVNDIRIVIRHSGERLPTWILKEKGVVSGIKCFDSTDLAPFIGKKLDAFGLWNGYYLTVEGDKDYYIRVL